MQQPQPPQPQLVLRMQQLLESLGVQDHEPRVVNQLVDFVFRYVTDVLLDAESYSVHAGKPAGQVDLDSVMLAIQARSSFAFAQPPDHDEVQGLAAAANDRDMPKFPAVRMGLLIPEDKDCLTAQNYTINPPKDS